MKNSEIIIMPAYNEAKNIVKVVSSVKFLFPEYQVLVINDGSSDNTSELASEAGATVIDHPFNMGYGVAIQTGYKYAYRNGYNYLVQMDSDGQHAIEEISKLLANVTDGSCEIVFGSRYIEENGYKKSMFRYIGTLFFRILLGMMTGRKITDPTTGFQAMNRNVLKIFIKDLFPCDYPDADIMILLTEIGIKFKEIPVKMFNRNDGKSMHNNPFEVCYYLFKMSLSMCVTKIRKYS
ncbi:glycosyltransferase family 2 protein [Desulfobacula phenolica]|uniref:Glycosyltransferase 2-like domain-containing protein n=1 Tax=Desulfobacula phenolica TaxID=90732 RepID=A0A1H2DSY3_9BACT|nr:glycosyltransferase family 2 protein [Desulfobacula phenolica]SDT85528.1 hypothetical protein SAMN04487931_10239 [Desulfobacula phenolica]